MLLFPTSLSRKGEGLKSGVTLCIMMNTTLILCILVVVVHFMGKMITSDLMVSLNHDFISQMAALLSLNMLNRYFGE